MRPLEHRRGLASVCVTFGLVGCPSDAPELDAGATGSSTNAGTSTTTAADPSSSTTAPADDTRGTSSSSETGIIFLPSNDGGPDFECDVFRQVIIETIRDNDGPSNQHVVVVGGRGMGKTTLVSRVAIAVNQDAELSQRWTPVLFGEESYDIGSVGELWLAALQRLAETVGTERWREGFEAARAEQDEQRLRERALGRLLDYARDTRKRILLVVENLDMILGEQIEADDAWTLRHTLQQHPEIMLLATAIDYERVFGRKELPLYGFAREHRLLPLTLGETRALWTRVANEPRSERAMIPVHRLTGGNPRLVTIVASFSAGRSFRQLMDELTALIDEHTSYFKANVEALAPSERRVYSALADLWAPATSRQVAERCRMSVSKASALIARLVNRRMVEEVGKEGRTKRFQLTERLYNVYHLLRGRGGEQRSKLKGLVEFMAMFYESDELVEVMSKLAHEATGLPQTEWGEYLEAYAQLMERLPDQSQIFRVTPDAFLLRMVQLLLPGVDASLAFEILSKAKPCLLAVNRFLESPEEATAAAAIAALAELFLIDGPQVLGHLVNFVMFETRTPTQGSPSPWRPRDWLSLVTRLLLWSGGAEQALAAFDRLRRAFPEEQDVLRSMALVLLRMNRADEALVHARTLTRVVPEDPKAWALLGCVLESKGDYHQAVAAYRKSLEAEPQPRVQLWLAAALARTGGHVDEIRRLVSEISFQDGEPSRWLLIAESESDPVRACEIAKQVLMKGDLALSLLALRIVIHAAGSDEDGYLQVIRETVSAEPGSPGAAIGIMMQLLINERVGVEIDKSWPLFKGLLKHPIWQIDPLRMATMVGSTILRLAGREPARVLALLEEIEGNAAANPIVVAIRMALGGDVSDAPAELLQVARDIVSVLTKPADV